MTVNDILALAKAGFTATQIAAINAAFGTPPAAPAPAPAPAPAATPAPAAPVDQSAEILKQLGIISGQITAANIAGTQQPPTQTADQILAEIIAPPKKEG